MRKQLVVSLLLLISSVTISFGHTYHGVSMAPNTLKGWVVASDTAGYVLHTPNCGISWIIQRTPDERRLYDVFFLTEQKGWICSDQGFVFYSPNGGDTWIRQTAGLAHIANRIFFLDDSCGWVVCNRAIVGQTTHGGHYGSWEQIFLPYPQYHCDTVYLYGVSFVDSLKGWFCSGRYPIYFDTLPGQGDTWYTRGQGYIAKSGDGGLNWQLLLRDTINDFFDIKFLDTLNGFVVGGNDRTMSATVMKTQNGGVTWQSVTIPAQARFLRSLKILGTNKIWAVGHNGTILHSNNEGINWTLQTCPVDTTLYDVDFSDSIYGLIAGDCYVLYTHNGGNTWHIANLGIEEEIARVAFGNNAMTQSVRIHPSPARSFFTIHLPQSANRAMIKIFDVSGKLIRKIPTDQSIVRYDEAQEMKVSLDGINAGVYFITFDTESIKSVKRLVIIK